MIRNCMLAACLLLSPASAFWGSYKTKQAKTIAPARSTAELKNRFTRAHDQIWIDSETTTLRDAFDRHVIFHGVNVVYKVPPYMPTQDVWDPENSLNDKDIDDLASWGFNLVRLGVMWESVESSPGVYNATYLEEVDKLVTKLGEKGIYTMIDAHQDVLARQICGEGMPNFYARDILKESTYCLDKRLDFVLAPIARLFGACKSMSSYGYAKDADGNPEIADCQSVPFFIYYTSPESFSLFRALYNNDLGMTDKFVDYWAEVSQKLSHNKYIIGYDPINEPLPSGRTIKEFIELFLPGTYDRRQATPLYEKIYSKYKDADPESIMYFEPAQVPDVYGGFTGLDVNLINKLGFDTPPGGEIGSPYHVLNDHTYCCQVTPSMCDSGEPKTDDKSATTCAKWHRDRLNQRSSDAKGLGVPLFISEFGACLDSDVCAREINQVAEESDKQLAGWAYWQYKTYQDLTTSAGDQSEGFYSPDGTIHASKVKALTRSYVKAAQGTIQSMQFTIEDGVMENAGDFTTDITIDTSITAPTEIHAFHQDTNEFTWYPNGVSVEALSLTGSVPATVEQTIEGNVIKIRVTNAEFNGQKLRITVTNKGSN